MDIEFDPAKDKANKAKHGVSLARAAELDWSRAISRIDDRFDYGEERLQVLAHMGDNLYVAVLTWRGGGRVARIISLRRASKKEREYYEQEADY